MPDEGLGSWPMRRARINPDAVAFRQGERCLTYGRLAARVESLADALAARGVAPGDRIAYLGPNDITTWETFFTAGRLGAVFVPLNTRLSPDEIEYMLADSGATVLVHAPETAALAAAADPRAAGVCTVISLAGTSPVSATVDYDTLVATEHPPRRQADVAMADPALILYTSGTTGRPKGAVLTHASVTFNTVNQLAHLDVLSTDIVVCTAPLFHVTGLGLVSLPALFKGATVVMATKFDPAWLLTTIEQQSITGFAAVPTMLQMVAEHPRFDDTDISSLRYVVFGGSPIPEDVAKAWQHRDVPMLHGYGLTEASPGVFMTPPHQSKRDPQSAGVPHFFTSVQLRQDNGTLIDPPGTGELVISGPQVFDGYWQRPEESATVLDNHWLRTGDVASVADDGWTRIVGRVKEMYISGGENVYPAEIERLIDQLPAVASSAVIGVPDQQWGEVGCAFVQLHAGAALDGPQLLAHLADHLARYKIPRHVRFVDHLPRTATGKLRRPDLRTAYDQERSR
ncbi:long-chain fatty acid--CoA ligase [Streptomyces sp. NBC_01643]|uniref:acyl-CoA synthetase n=1 Tax=Streptomyces sp. NBC_01643 TaxID=2975906 RepID=UPI002F91742A|nr:long-chain fatty acid--CoA ligase [Streptomyces sp. NBC_01643]